VTKTIVDAIIEHLGLERHPEGGWYVETWRDAPPDGRRGAGTAIYYLLAEGQRSHWHRIDATEVWHFYAGGPLRLSTHDGIGPAREITLGRDLAAGQVPQATVLPGTWQAAEPLGPWTLAGCTVAPAFSFDGFELAPPDWEPPP
jgi:hypothetical protein